MTISAPQSQHSSSISLAGDANSGNNVLQQLQNLTKLMETQEVALFSIPSSDVNPSLVPFLHQTKLCNRKAKDMLAEILASMKSSDNPTPEQLKNSNYSLDGADILVSSRRMGLQDIIKTETPLPTVHTTPYDESSTSTPTVKSPTQRPQQTKRTGSTSVLERAADALTAFGFPPPPTSSSSVEPEEDELEMPSFSHPVAPPSISSTSLSSSTSSTFSSTFSQNYKPVTHTPSSSSPAYRPSPLVVHNLPKKKKKSFSSFFKKSKKEEKAIHLSQATLTTTEHPSPHQQEKQYNKGDVSPNLGRKNSKRRIMSTFTRSFMFTPKEKSSTKSAPTSSTQKEKGKQAEVDQSSTKSSVNSPAYQAIKEYSQLNQISTNLYAQKRDAIEASSP